MVRACWKEDTPLPFGATNGLEITGTFRLSQPEILDSMCVYIHTGYESGLSERAMLIDVTTHHCLLVFPTASKSLATLRPNSRFRYILRCTVQTRYDSMLDKSEGGP